MVDDNSPPAPMPSSSTFHCNLTREIILFFLQCCGVTYEMIPFDEHFETMCLADARRRGYHVDGPSSLRPFIPGGVAMATTAYAHLPSYATRIFVALYTSFLIYLDDVYQHSIGAVSEFNQRFVHNRLQDDPVLDNFANLLLEIPHHFDRTASNMILTSTLNLVTALSLEYETRDMALSSCATSYPTFSRVMSGASEAYALFAFPMNLPLTAYIQSLPDLMVYINNGNDILSFYKEELAGEVVNRVSFLAECYGISKHDALYHLALGAIGAHHRTLHILVSNSEAFKAYQQFRRGYIGFHAALSRYKLEELQLLEP